MTECEDAMPQQVSKSDKPLGPIGTKVLFENEHIRVWSVELEPKGRQPLHEHASNGCSQPRKPAPKWAVPIPSR